MLTHKSIRTEARLWYNRESMRDKILRFLGYDTEQFDKSAFIRNAIVSFIAIFGMGFFLSFLIMADYGTDPYTFMNRSLAARLGMTLGNWQLILLPHSLRVRSYLR